MLDCDLDGVGVFKSVQLERLTLLADNEIFPHFPFRKDVVDGKVAHPAGKTFIQPQIIPPLHSDKIAEPLVSELVGDNIGDPLLHVQASVGGVE